MKWVLIEPEKEKAKVNLPIAIEAELSHRRAFRCLPIFLFLFSCFFTHIGMATLTLAHFHHAKDCLNFLVLSLSIRYSVSASSAFVFFRFANVCLFLFHFFWRKVFLNVMFFACFILPPLSSLSPSQRRFLQLATTTRLSNKKFANLFMLINNKQINWKSKTERMKMKVCLCKGELVQGKRKRGWQINLCDLLSQRAASSNWRDQITEPADCLPKASLAPVDFLYLNILLKAACSFPLRLSLVVFVCVCVWLIASHDQSAIWLGFSFKLQAYKNCFNFWRWFQFNIVCSTNQHFFLASSLKETVKWQCLIMRPMDEGNYSKNGHFWQSENDFKWHFAFRFCLQYLSTF